MYCCYVTLNISGPVHIVRSYLHVCAAGCSHVTVTCSLQSASLDQQSALPTYVCTHTVCVGGASPASYSAVLRDITADCSSYVIPSLSVSVWPFEVCTSFCQSKASTAVNVQC